MRSVSVRLEDLKNMVLCLGYVGENEHTRVTFDAMKMYAQYPHASVSLTVQPPEGDAYPAVIERDGDLVIWEVTDSDLIHEGGGELQLSFTDGEKVAKTYIGRFRVNRSIMPTGEIPDPLDDFLTRAGAALTAIPETIDEEFEAITAEAVTLEPGSSATAEFDPETKILTIGVPEGEKGDPGQDGADGLDGYTPQRGVDYWTPADQAAMLQDIATEKADAIAAIENKGTQQVGLVTDEGTTQKAAVQAKGDEVLESIPSDYSTLSSDVSDLKSALNFTKTATPGYIMRATNTGTGQEWAQVGTPTDEQAEEAINAWLDDHPEATTTVDFSIATKVFYTVDAMYADLTLKNGDNVATKGYYAAGDNGGANYTVSSSHTGIFYITLANGLYANRIDESSLIKAESIGIKAHAATVAEPDAEEMSNNVQLFNTAVYNGIYLIFGKGYFYFNDAVQLAHKNTYTIRGLAREATHLFFPESDGFLFSDPIYYNYYVIKGMHIHAYGHTIRCAEHCLTILDSHFEWLQLESETGDCFHAPDYNVAKYVNEGGTTIYDTCVQNCVFDFVNASAPQGAAFCNIMGMYTYYQHMNLVSCKYGFRNCDGHAEQINTLGSQLDYFIYYDKSASYSLRWKFINVNAEALAKAFIYTEPRKAAGPGEDPKKPETACTCAIMELTAINSGWSLRFVESGHDIYPITVQEIKRIDLINSDAIITPHQYPSVYDTTAVKGVIRITTGSKMYRYNGGKTIQVVATGSAQVTTYYGTKDRKLLIPSDAPSETNTRFPEYEEAILADRFHGGRSRQVYWLTSSSDNYIEFTDQTIPYEYAYYDVIDIKLTGTGSATSISMRNCNVRYQEVGKLVTVRNNAASTKDLVLVHRYYQSHNVFYFADEQSHTLSPGEVAHFIITMQDINGTKKGAEATDTFVKK